MRAIDADALEAYWECFDDPDLDYQYVFKSDIDAAPTIEPKHGRWLPCEDELYAGGGYNKCSVCGYCFSFKGYFELETMGYCPNCGAEMDKEEK